jgi:hypothetical protein
MHFRTWSQGRANRRDPSAGVSAGSTPGLRRSLIRRSCLLVAIAALGGTLVAGCGGSSSSSSSTTPAAGATSTTTSSPTAVTTATSSPTTTTRTTTAHVTSTATTSKASAGGSGGTALTTGGGSSGGSGLALSPALAADVARCKSAIAAASTLSSDVKAKLESLCDEAAKGDPAALRAATARVCQEIVKETVPASSQATALSACPKP